MIEIYFQDLTTEKQQEVLDKIGDNGNWDVIPMFIIDDEEYNNFDDENFN